MLTCKKSVAECGLNCEYCYGFKEDLICTYKAIMSEWHVGKNREDLFKNCPLKEVDDE